MSKNILPKSILIPVLALLCSILLWPMDTAAASTDTDHTSIEFSAKELEYLDRADEIIIGCPVNNCPLLFQNEKTGQPEGITIDILNMIAEKTGLTFRYQALPSGSIGYEELQRCQVDMLACVETNEFNQRSPGLVLTNTYLHAAKVFVCKEGTEIHPDSPMTIAVNSGSQTLEKVIRKQYPLSQVLFYTSTEDALSALLSGEADAVLQNQYAVERILNKPLYENLRIVASAAIGDSHCLGYLVPTDSDSQNIISSDTTLLLSILNKGIAALDQGQVAFAIIKSTSENAYHFTLWDTIYHYRYATVVLFVSLLMILILLRKNFILRRKRKEQMEAQQRARKLAAINAQMKEQQLLLADSLKRAEEGNRAKTSFLFNISHDIRTPMNAILGFTEIAGHSMDDPAKLADCLDKIQVSGKHLLQLINNVLDMTRIENGDLTLTEDYCDLKECIEKTRDIFQAEIDQKHLNLQTDTSTVKNNLVCCDSLRFNQILYNLVSNAVKFTRRDGNIRITLTQTPCAIREYASYEMRVKDDGIGMSTEFLAHIFEPFEREYTSTISRTQGTGLGMSITKKLVDLMGGTIQAASAPNEGTEFVLQFTFRLQEQQAPGQQEEQEPPAQPAHTDDFAGRRLLLAEDNELNMEITRELLGENGFLVETALNGQIAVDMVQNSAPGYYDAILMDIQMPVMDGYRASRAIRGLENKALAAIPIIAVTANAFDEDKKEALANGMNAHIAKPLDIGLLLETLENILISK